jgi:hypothetical protein
MNKRQVIQKHKIENGNRECMDHAKLSRGDIGLMGVCFLQDIRRENNLR